MKQKEEVISIIVGHNPIKHDNKVLKNFKKKWKITHDVVVGDDGEALIGDDGEAIIEQTGLHPLLAALPVETITTSRNEYIRVVSNLSHTPLFQLQADKALQLKTLEDFLRGYLKQNKKWL